MKIRSFTFASLILTFFAACAFAQTDTNSVPGGPDNVNVPETNVPAAPASLANTTANTVITNGSVPANIDSNTAGNAAANSANLMGPVVVAPAAPDAPVAAEADTSKFNSFRLIGPSGGDIRSIAIDPKNKNNLYVSTLDSQVYGSSDAGRSWHLLATFARPQIILDDLRVDNTDSRILYVSGHRNRDPGGFFKSTDGGLTWKEAKDLHDQPVWALHQSSMNPNLMLAGTPTGIFRSNDRGDSWQRIPSSTMPTYIDSLAIDPKDTNIMYAGTTYRAYKSTDGGANWRLVKAGMIDDSDVFAIDIDPRDPNHVIASACSGIYESYNKGELWKKAQGIPSTSRRTRAIMFNPGAPGAILAGTTEGFWMTPGGAGWLLTTSKALEINSIAVHPSEPNKVYIATNNYGVMVSSDGGRTFSQFNGNFTSRMIFSVTPDVERSNRIYTTTNNTAGGGGFVFVSDDDGQTWLPSMRNLVANNDVPITLLQDKINPNLIYLGTNSGIFRSIDRGASWTKIVVKPAAKGKVTFKKVGKKMVAVKPPPPDPKFVAGLGEKVNTLAYTNDGKNGIFAATESGLYRTYNIDKGWERVWQQTVMSASLKQNVTERVFEIKVSPTDPDKLWIGTASSGVLTSSDGGATWHTVSDIPSTVPISAIEISAARPDYIFVGTAQALYLSRDGGQKWSRRGGNLPLGDYGSIVINPKKPDEVFVASSYENNGGIYQSTNGGMNWKRVDPKEWSLPTTRIRTMVLDPNNPNRIFAGSHSSGIYLLERSAVAENSGESRPRSASGVQ
jgi:photosystem II stability/assembly factor-like uncharacterized protein